MNPDQMPPSGSDRPTIEQLRAELTRISGGGSRKGPGGPSGKSRKKGRGFLRFLLILLLIAALLAAAVILLFPAFVVYGSSMVPALLSICFIYIFCAPVDNRLPPFLEAVPRDDLLTEALQELRLFDYRIGFTIFITHIHRIDMVR